MQENLTGAQAQNTNYPMWPTRKDEMSFVCGHLDVGPTRGE